MTATVVGSPGNYYDWIGVYVASRTDRRVLQKVDLPPFATEFEWTVTMSTGYGDYNFRFFEDLDTIDWPQMRPWR